MQKLKDALIRQYEDSTEYNIQVYNPKNTQPVELYFRGEKSAKVIGKLAANTPPKVDAEISGVLVKRNFKYSVITAEDLPNYTDLAISNVLQRQSVPFKGNHDLLMFAIQKNFGNYKQIDGACVKVRVLDAIDMYFEKGFIILEVFLTFLKYPNKPKIFQFVFKVEFKSYQ
jgi:cleavage and polyadenylation specificity factor subunit 3